VTLNRESARQLPWLAVQAYTQRDALAQCDSFREGLHLAGLDWEPEKVPLTHHVMTERGVEAKQLDEWMLTRRDDNHAPLGVVGSGYKVYPNRTFAEFMDTLVDTDEAAFAGMGSVHGGRRVYAVMKFGENQYRSLGADEEIAPYLIGTTGHDGGAALGITVAMIRYACTNGMIGVVPGSAFSMKVRHTYNMERLIRIRAKLFTGAAEYVDVFYNTVEDLLAIKVTEDDALHLIHQLAPLPKNATARQVTTVNRKVQGMYRMYLSSPNIENIRDTGWGFVNAIAEWDQHAAHGRRTKDAMTRLIDGDDAKVVARARALVMA